MINILIIILSILFAISNTDVHASYCNELKVKYNPKAKSYKYTKYVSIDGEVKNVTIYWNNEKTRAASAILAVLLRYAVGYQNVHLDKEPHKGPQNDEVMLALSDPSQKLHLRNLGSTAGTNCTHQINYGLKRLHVYLPTEFRNLKECVNVTEWSFYANLTALTECGFFKNTSSRMVHELVLYKNSRETNIIENELREYTTVPNLTLKVYPIAIHNCSILFGMLETCKYSFLFIDDDIWSRHENVTKVQLPKCRSNKDITKLDTTVHIYLTNASHFVEYAPLIHQIAGHFKPSFESLNKILQRESNNLEATIYTAIEEAACEWAFHNTEAKDWIPKENDVYNIMVFLNAHDFDLYKKMFDLLSYLIKPRMKGRYKNSFHITFFPYIDGNDVRNTIDGILKAKSSCAIRKRQRLLGAVVGSMKNIWEIANAVDGVNLPVLLYDGAGIDVKSKINVWLTSGTSMHLALGLQKFINFKNWTRIAVLSDTTLTAKTLFNDLKGLGDFELREFPVQSNLSQLQADLLLHELKTDNARIIFVNTNYDDALTILLAAAAIESKDDYVWIVRDWLPNNLISNITLISISLWCRNNKDIDKRDGWLDLREEMKKSWPNTDWPIHATALVDSVLTLVHGFETVFQKYPQIRNDIHSKLAMKEFERSLIEKPVKGAIQNLTFKDHTLENAVVFVEEWKGELRNLLAKWEVNPTKHDGTNNFDSYQTYWYDILLGVLVTILLAFLIWLAYIMVRTPRYRVVNTH